MTIMQNGNVGNQPMTQTAPSESFDQRKSFKRSSGHF